ncbi:5279_t:CDS:2 [Funneliformis geosporum]|uniref:Polynucleotide phosphorylase 1 n=1 Tax=Funneliformis geosporum TaxID=1117311 RepID=A0A9W4WRA8_9GLOM|nr:5279_t:CDS:2 [Funneliformis geosporum]
MRKLWQEKQVRLDGRGAEQIRPLEIKIDYLPNVHGSAVFARGETKVLSVITVGKISEKQLVDSIFNRFHKYFIHHYNFPPFAVNEMASYRSVSRREIGHGELVEKTFDYLIPSTELFPYTVRAVSEVLSSDGSSSQASICATSLSLMATGVPLTRPAAGIALGLFEGQIYNDINGLEDKLGEMDFKIAGTEKGVCSLQLDVKNQGISQALIKTSFEKARQARSHLLKEMKSHIYHPRPNLPTQVIKCRCFYVEKEKIGLVIGSRGKTINQLTEETGSTIEVQNDGYILVYHQEEDKLEKTCQAIKKIIKGETVGKLASSRGGDFKRAYDATQTGLTYGTPTGQFTAHEIHKANGEDYNPDKNPSCSFEPNRKIFTCFTCGFKASDIFSFWAQYQKITLEAAAEEIGQMGYFPLSILREKKQEEQKEKNKVFYLLSLITEIYQHNLLTQAGREVLKYLQIERQLDQKTIDHFGLGVTNLVLVTENNRVCDFFPTQHLIIPLTNSESKIVAFAARKIGEIPTGEGKYKYLPSYQYYQKSSLLYNYPTAKKNRTEECYLVEGFFDVISLHKLGIENCLALLGTNLSETQIKLLIELKKRIILFLDSDKAGREAAVNVAVKLLLKEVDCEVIKGNYEGDPDEICQQQTKEKVGNNPQRISRFVSEMAEVFRKFKPSIYDFLITKISSLVG